MFKDILVHLDGGDRDSMQCAVAVGLASRFGARLTGLFARSEQLWAATVARRSSDAFEAAAQQSQDQFAAATRDLGINSRWWRLAHGEPSHVLIETMAAARFHDLLVIGQHHDGKKAPDDLIEKVILQSGRPVLIVPAVGHYPSVGTNVLVAWNGSREAARALHDGLPLIVTANNVEVLTVRGPGAEPSDVPLPPLSILDHLAAHGARVTRDVLAGEDIGIMDLILSRTFDQGADLLVMGAHGGYQLPFFKGAGTRYILDHMTLPVLMAH